VLSGSFPPPWLSSVISKTRGDTFSVECDALFSLCVLCAFMMDTENRFSIDLDCLSRDVAEHRSVGDEVNKRSGDFNSTKCYTFIFKPGC
jgi:hypothetical protein